jgi:hypothetical protein
MEILTKGFKVIISSGEIGAKVKIHPHIDNKPSQVVAEEKI